MIILLGPAQTQSVRLPDGTRGLRRQRRGRRQQHFLKRHQARFEGGSARGQIVEDPLPLDQAAPAPARVSTRTLPLTGRRSPAGLMTALSPMITAPRCPQQELLGAG